MLRWAWSLGVVVAVAGCGAPRAEGPAVADAPGENGGEDGGGEPDCTPTQEEPPPAPPAPTDIMSGTRRLRRAVVTLTGHAPSFEALAAVRDAPDEATRERLIDEAVDAALSSPAFYEKMLELGHDWLRTGRYTTGASGDTYYGHMAGSLARCRAESAHPGAWFVSADGGGASDPASVCDQAEPPAVIEPWWAPGTTVEVVGRAGNGVRTHPRADGTGEYQCGSFGGAYFTAGNADVPGPPGTAPCGCGPNLVWCYPDGSGFAQSNTLDEALQRRMAWEEPARLLGHLAWHDRPLTDLVTGNYSVGPNKLRHLYLRFGRQNLSHLEIDDAPWWKNEEPVPVAPGEDPSSPAAWREFVVESVNPLLLSDRDYTYDPRTTLEEPRGVPAAGVLTMMGSQSSFARERVRAARWLEIFACREFSPPSADLEFEPFDVDPATTGTCQHCHALMDPAAMFFKRWDFGNHYIAITPMMPGISPWLYPEDYTRSGQPYARWVDAWRPGTVLTPITEQDVEFNPYAILMDKLPDGQKLLGVEGDGTIGPLGFGKILVESGEFDRCATRVLAERVLGRRLDPAKEAGYLDALTREFVDGGRRVRPFFKHLTTRPEFARGL